MQLSFKNSHPPARQRTLADLRPDEAATLDRIELPGELSNRLMELGFVPGNQVAALHTAPGGDPRVFRVDGSEIALRRETARHIHLRKS